MRFASTRIKPYFCVPGNATQHVNLLLGTYRMGTAAPQAGLVMTQTTVHHASMQLDPESADQQQAVARIAGAIAHELNNPLQGILSLVGLTIRECHLDERCQARVEQILHGVTRMSRTVESLSAIYENLPRPPDLVPLTELLNSLAASLADRGFRVQLDADGSGSAVAGYIPEVVRLTSDLFREHTDGNGSLVIAAWTHGDGIAVYCEVAGSEPEPEREGWQALPGLSGVSGMAVLLDQIVMLSQGRVEFKWRDSALAGIRVWLQTV